MSFREKHTNRKTYESQKPCKIRRNGRKARNHGIARTPYMSNRKMFYVSFHTRAISMGITKSESQTLMDAASKLKGILCVKRTGSPAALS